VLHVPVIPRLKEKTVRSGFFSLCQHS
jgi:hypothetical protein